MERMESMEPISAYYTTAYPEIQPDSTYGSRETTESQAMTPPPPTYDEELVHKVRPCGHHDTTTGFIVRSTFMHLLVPFKRWAFFFHVIFLLVYFFLFITGEM